MAKRQQERYRRMKVTKPRDISAKAIGKSLVAGSLGMPADLAQMAMMAQPGAMMSPTVREAADKMPLTSEKIAQSMDVDTESPEFLTGSVLAPGPPGSSAVKLAKAGTVAKNLAGALPVVGSMKKVFTSPAVKAVSEIKQNKMPANQWISQMKSRGVKQDELTWTGVEDWLKSQDKSVTKQDLNEYLEANQIQVQEVVKGKPEEVTKINNEIQELETQIAQLQTQMDTPVEIAGPFVESVPQGDKNSALIQKIQELNLKKFELEKYAEVPKFKEYTLPGGENYRELLLTLPSKKMVDPVKRYDELNDIAARRNLTEAEEAEMVAIERQQFNQESGTVGTDFVSGHYDEPNIVAHIRFNERVDADGNKVLFIEEIQSDWAQKGRKSGFLSPKQEEVQKLIDEKSEIVERAERGMSESGGTYMKIRSEDLDRYNEIENILDNTPLDDFPGSVGGVPRVPQAPFVMDTNQWTSLALKRMVRWATDNDFDQIAWTTGKQQAKRYDLSKQVESINVRRSMSDDTYVVSGMTSGNQDNFMRKIQSLDQLDDIIGKELADKARTDLAKLDDPGGQVTDYDGVTYRGVDLELGGEGMGAFYDKILVDRAKKLGKQYGSKVEKGEIVTDDFQYEIKEVFPETFQVHYAGRDGGTEVNEFTGPNAAEEAERFALSFPVSEQGTEVWTMNLTDKLKKAAKDGLPYYVALPPIIAGVASQQAEASEVKKPAVQVKSNRIMEEAMP